MSMITQAMWTSYTAKLARINAKAAEAMQKWVNAHGYDDFDAMCEYAQALTSRYGSAAASLACEMYEATAAAQGVTIAAAIPAETASVGTIRHLLGEAANKSVTLIAPEVAKMVKQTAADTTLRNAARDGAEWAWIPHGGETCAWCIALASRGWQRAGPEMRTQHAEHIHAHCQCEFAVRFGKRNGVSGYDPKDYLKIYNQYGGGGADRINALRRAMSEENKEAINAQKRAAYAARIERQAEENQ